MVVTDTGAPEDVAFDGAADAADAVASSLDSAPVDGAVMADAPSEDRGEASDVADPGESVDVRGAASDSAATCGDGGIACGALCVDPVTDVLHCGGCDLACHLANANEGCAAGACVVLSCHPGFSDCDALAATGCEAPTDTDRNCGACGRACAAGTRCAAGACVSVCPTGATYCAGGGVCAHLASDVMNCGSCGSGCPGASNATPTCTAGRCVVACTPGFGDCDGVALNGCEARLGDDPAHCGACGRACAAPANGSADCTAGACIASCAAGYSLQGSACAAIAPPRPLSPLSTATVTSQRPTLRWVLGSGLDGALVQICRDRACTTVEQTLPVAGSSVSAGTLTPGVHYWRLYGRSGPRTGTTSGPTWELFVGRRSAPVDTSWGSVADFNGDSNTDLAITGYAASATIGRVFIYLGTAAGIGATPSATLTRLDAGMGFGVSIASAGDVNGDGYADLAIGDSYVSNYTGRVYVYFGGASGLGATAAVALAGPDGPNGYFGQSVVGVGDVNGDGYADVAVGEAHATGAGRVHVYAGGRTGLAPTPTFSLNAPDGGLFGYTVASAGDVNGDGYADLAVGALNALSGTGRAYVFTGSSRGLAATPTTTLTGPDSGGFSASLGTAGDLNGDGYADLAVGAEGVLSQTGRAYVYLGGAEGVAIVPSTTLNAPGGAGGGFGVQVAGAGDLNADGFSDLVVGANRELGNTGRLYVYPGRATGPSTTPTNTLTGTTGGGLFGGAVTSAGDINADGYGDLAVAAQNANRVFVYQGGSGGLTGAAALTLTATPEISGFGARLPR